MNTIWQPTLDPAIKPKYRGVVQAIREGIGVGTLSPGDKLPPVRDLGWRLGMTPGTVARAYTILTDEGALIAEVGRGTFVAGKVARERPLNLLEEDTVGHGAGGDTDMVNLFSPHLPDCGQARLIRDMLVEVAQDPPSGVMHYPTRAGARPARDAMLHWLRGTPLGPVDPEDMVLSHGGQNGIMLVYQTVLKGRRPVVLVEELSYPGFRRAAEALRADVIPVSMDDEGIEPDALRATLARHPDAQILCTSPEVHSPTCIFTPAARRQQIAQIARENDMSILEDDCYRMGRAEAPGYRQLAPERSYYVTSLSKSITPALRLGCVIGPKSRGNALHRSAEHGFFGLATPMTDLAAKLMMHPELDAVMARSRAGVEQYVKAVVNILGGHDLRWRSDVPFIWMQLPIGWRAGAFCRAAEERGVRLRAAEEFAIRDARAPHAVRMAINAGVSLRSFEAAMERLRDLLDNPSNEIGV